jgi:hypothetical protein
MLLLRKSVLLSFEVSSSLEFILRVRSLWLSLIMPTSVVRSFEIDKSEIAEVEFDIAGVYVRCCTCSGKEQSGYRFFV